MRTTAQCEPTVDSILTDDGPRNEDKDYAVTVVDNTYRNIEFWIHWEDAREPGDGEL